MSSPEHRTAATSAASPPPRWHWRSTAWIAVAALLGFATGFFLQRSRLNDAQNDLAWTTRAMHAARSEAALGGAVIEAQGARYEAARQRASEFYSGLQRQLLPSLAVEHQPAARVLLSERDSIITSLARGDPSSAGVLLSVLERLRITMRRAAPDSSGVSIGPAR